MASPALESFCCMFNYSILPSDDQATHSHSHGDKVFGLDADGFRTYNILCIVSSLLGISGATFLLWPRPQPSSARSSVRETSAFVRQISIISYLAFADMLAAAGILLRSALWLSGQIPLKHVQATSASDFPHLFCAITTGIIQYFYVCTYMWTFCYALDTYLLSMNKRGYHLAYHFISWVLSALVCGAGLISLYYPNLLSCELSVSNLLPHYLSTYIPILITMILNPILYVKASKSVQESMRSSGLYTNAERQKLSNMKHRFLAFVVVFYICWSPNIINGILLIFKRSVPEMVFLGLWQYMAMVNPAQALLNALVYKGGGCCIQWRTERTNDSQCTVQDNIYDTSNEDSPLLSFRAS